MTLELPAKKITHSLVTFLEETFEKTSKKNGVIAVSGGIDSALSLTLLTKALGPDQVFPIFLPYGTQSTEDAKKIASWNKIPEKNWREIQIKPAVDSLVKTVDAENSELRKGNIMARTRMILLYDTARELDGLVCGTENKSEMYLGYFTRFGDEASDIEPLQSLYKTQVRQLAEYLELPTVFLEKAPSAGLWQDQTDEEELGFSYEQADQVLLAFVENESTLAQSKKISAIPEQVVQRVLARVKSQQFKHQVPYTL